MYIFFGSSLIFLSTVSARDNVTVPVTQLTMCYFIERNTRGIIYDYNKAAAALDLAMSYANDVILPPEVQLTSVYRDIGRTCGGKTEVVGLALKLRDDGVNCSVYIGPGNEKHECNLSKYCK